LAEIEESLFWGKPANANLGNCRYATLDAFNSEAVLFIAKLNGWDLPAKFVDYMSKVIIKKLRYNFEAHLANTSMKLALWTNNASESMNAKLKKAINNEKQDFAGIVNSLDMVTKFCEGTNLEAIKGRGSILKLNSGIPAYQAINVLRFTSENDLQKKVKMFQRALPKANIRTFVDADTDEVCTEPRFRGRKPNQIRGATLKTRARKQLRARMT
jgi:hypothetical protein